MAILIMPSLSLSDVVGGGGGFERFAIEIYTRAVVWL